MPTRRDIRRLAMQVLYQIDVTGEMEREALLGSLDEDYDPPAAREPAVELALAAWADRAVADRLIAELAPDWPTHRQPPVDRSILRLGCYEMRSGYSPAKVAINEAVELAKRYAGATSPSFINGVLDKLAKRLETHAEPEPAPPPAAAADAWLDDAINEQHGEDEKEPKKPTD